MRRTTAEPSPSLGSVTGTRALSPAAARRVSDPRGNVALTHEERVGRETGSDLLPGASRSGG